MSTAKKLAPVEDGRGFSMPFWWRPKKIAIHNGRKWRTVIHSHFQFTAMVKECQTFAVSPVDVDGMAHFVAWDVDDHDPASVQALLAALPPGCHPLVSISGKKGFHVWLFTSEPVPVDVAAVFAKAVAQRAGVACECFPTGRNSRCLKWPNSVHPETNVVETFVPLDNLEDVDRFDTALILQAIADGHYRTPAAVVTAAVETTTKPVAAATAKNPTATGTDNLAANPALAFGLAHLCGRRVNRFGQPFKCILPDHEERRPSAAFHATEDGRILYHDFHARDGCEWYTLGEVYHAITTGRVEKLRPVEAARWLAALALRLGCKTKLAAVVEEKLASLSFVLQQLKLLKPKQTTGYICPVVCKTDRPVVHKAKNGKASGVSVVEKVWRVFCNEAMLSAMGGFEEVKLSSRFLASQTGLPLELANRGMNLLAVLGIVEKVPGSGGTKGDRYKPGAATREEAERRLKALFPAGIDLRKFNRDLVRERLGEDIAAAVFRREPAAGQTQRPQSEPVVAEQQQELAGIAAKIAEAEKAGQMEEVWRLLHVYNSMLKQRKTG